MTPPSTRPDRGILISRLTASSQWERLLDTAREWLAEDPENPSAHRCAAQALVNLNRRPEAEPHVSRALARNPDDAFAHRLMAIVQYDLKNYGAADKAIRRAIELRPNEAQNWYYLAQMCYWQKDLKNGLKWSAKARELEPRNPDILNLYALCSDEGDIRPELLAEVLALDPENASALNNLGVHHLNRSKDYAKAAEYFRQSLRLDPTSKIARKNLLLAVKRSDPIYRTLCAPRDLLFKLRNSLLRDSRGNVLVFILGIIVWLFLARFFLAALILWLGLVWPLTKFYEFLVMGDFRRKAGEVAGNRGGFLNFRRWPKTIRLALFCAVLVGFWSSIAYVFFSAAAAKHISDDTRLTIGGVLWGAVLVGLLIFFGFRLGKGVYFRYHSWRRDIRLRKLKTTKS